MVTATRSTGCGVRGPEPETEMVVIFPVTLGGLVSLARHEDLHDATALGRIIGAVHTAVRVQNRSMASSRGIRGEDGRRRTRLRRQKTVGTLSAVFHDHGRSRDEWSPDLIRHDGGDLGPPGIDNRRREA